ncbi:MAG TPA: hypothetical protein ENH11_03905 [Candidatus Acetothermia bacterium]|nr:hypothetical protein [Candidatus Acetothermia bacterium]
MGFGKATTGDIFLAAFGVSYLVGVLGAIGLAAIGGDKASAIELLEILLSPKVFTAILALLAGREFGPKLMALTEAKIKELGRRGQPSES